MGALPRIMKKQRPVDALILGIGVAILSNSRPFEGLVLCVPVAIALCVVALQQTQPRMANYISLRSRSANLRPDI